MVSDNSSPRHEKSVRAVEILSLGLFPLILTVLNRDYRTPYYNPYSGLLAKGGTSQPKPIHAERLVRTVELSELWCLAFLRVVSWALNMAPNLL